MMRKCQCPFCSKNIEPQDTGIGWRCPYCVGRIFTEYIDQEGIYHRYTDPTFEQKKLLDQSHIIDLDPADMMVGVTEPGPFFSCTFAFRLAKLADKLDEKGYIEEADLIDKVIKTDPITKELQNQTYIKLKYFPKDSIYSLSGEPLSNL